MFFPCLYGFSLCSHFLPPSKNILDKRICFVNFTLGVNVWVRCYAMDWHPILGEISHLLVSLQVNCCFSCVPPSPVDSDCILLHIKCCTYLRKIKKVLKCMNVVQKAYTYSSSLSLFSFALTTTESPRLSTDSSMSGHDPVLVDYCSLSIEHSDSERPVSTVSTVSSGSSGEGQSSLFSVSQCPQSLPLLSTETDINLELSPSEEPNEYPTELRPASKRPRQDLAAGQFNNNNTSSLGVITLPPSLDRPSPVASVVMAPNSQLTYVDRVVMEIIETERMYVRDLSSIVEVSKKTFRRIKHFLLVTAASKQKKKIWKLVYNVTLFDLFVHSFL